MTIMKTQTNQKLSDKLNHLVQQAVDNAIEKHRQKGESIAIADSEGKVTIVPATEIPNLKKSLLHTEG
jgi:20S proteasome alpha/beta subunit